LRPAFWAGRLDINMATSKKYTPEQVVRNITGRHPIDELDRLAVDRGYRAVLRRDNGPELACTAMADWAASRGRLIVGEKAEAMAREMQNENFWRQRDRA
jgi:hypothetical protein